MSSLPHHPDAMQLAPSAAVDWRDVFTVVIDQGVVAGVDVDRFLEAAAGLASELTDRMAAGGGREALFQQAAARVPQLVDLYLRPWLGHSDRRRVTESVYAAIRGGLAVTAAMRARITPARPMTAENGPAT